MPYGKGFKKGSKKGSKAKQSALSNYAGMSSTKSKMDKLGLADGGQVEKPESELKGKKMADEVIANKKLPPRKPMKPPQMSKPKKIGRYADGGKVKGYPCGNASRVKTHY
jgi:hypothetical protein